MEPERTPYDLEFRLLGIPVRVHPFFWLLTVILGGLSSGDFDPLYVLLFVLAAFLSILWHEMGHALAVRAFGERPWITLYAMGGLASYHTAGFSRRTDPTFRSVMISLAGPGNQLLLAALVAGIAVLNGYEVFRLGFVLVLDPRLADVNEVLYMFAQSLFLISYFWAILNLLPIWPLDGGRVMEALATRVNPRDGLRMTLITSIGACILVGALFIVRSGSLFNGLLFAYIGFQNYQVLQSINYRRW